MTQPLTPADLDAAARALFGAGYSAGDLGNALGISERNARYWLSGRSGPREPDDIRARLCALLTARRGDIGAALERLGA